VAAGRAHGAGEALTMADIDVRRVHGLGLSAARKAADKLAADLGPHAVKILGLVRNIK